MDLWLNSYASLTNEVPMSHAQSSLGAPQFGMTGLLKTLYIKNKKRHTLSIKTGLIPWPFNLLRWRIALETQLYSIDYVRSYSTSNAEICILAASQDLCEVYQDFQARGPTSFKNQLRSA